jgi:hypothetical protein
MSVPGPSALQRPYAPARHKPVFHLAGTVSTPERERKRIDETAVAQKRPLFRPCLCPGPSHSIIPWTV